MKNILLLWIFEEIERAQNMFFYNLNENLHCMPAFLAFFIQELIFSGKDVLETWMWSSPQILLSFHLAMGYSP